MRSRCADSLNKAVCALAQLIFCWKLMPGSAHIALDLRAEGLPACDVLACGLSPTSIFAREPIDCMRTVRVRNTDSFGASSLVALKI